MSAFTYRKRSPFNVWSRLAKYEFEDVNRLLSWSDEQSRSLRSELDRKPNDCGPEDMYSDEYGAIESFVQNYSQLVTIALWRCVEMTRKRFVQSVFGELRSRQAFRHNQFVKSLREIGIDESALAESHAMNELRLINNSVKHDGYISEKLAVFANWAGRVNQELGNVSPAYPRLHLAAQAYVEDLLSKGDEWWEKKPSQQ